MATIRNETKPKAKILAYINLKLIRQIPDEIKKQLKELPTAPINTGAALFQEDRRTEASMFKAAEKDDAQLFFFVGTLNDMRAIDPDNIELFEDF